MKSTRFQDVLWTPGQPIDPATPRMPADEVSRRLLHLEKIIDDPRTDLVDTAELGRKLEQTWHPDYNTLFDQVGRLSGVFNRVLWGRVSTTGTINGTGSGDWAAINTGLAGEVQIQPKPVLDRVPTVIAISENGNGAACALNGAPGTSIVNIRHFLTATSALSTGNLAFILAT